MCFQSCWGLGEAGTGMAALQTQQGEEMPSRERMKMKEWMERGGATAAVWSQWPVSTQPRATRCRVLGLTPGALCTGAFILLSKATALRPPCPPWGPLILAALFQAPCRPSALLLALSP